MGRFVSREEAAKLIAGRGGSKAAEDVDRVMGLNRGKEGCKGNSFPSEVQDSDNEEPEAQERGPVRSAITRQLTRAITGVHEACQQTLRSRLLLCCRRRRPRQGETGSESLRKSFRPTQEKSCGPQRRRRVTLKLQ